MPSANQLKQFLEKWRELVVLTDGLLGWEKDFFPAVLAVIVTFKFLMIWWLDANLLTLIGLVGAGFTLLDYLGPKLVDKVFKPENWTSTKEERFERACSEMASVGDCIFGLLAYVRDAKSQKPIMHFLGTVGSFLVLAYIGSKINNFFLFYLFTLVLVMLPGLHRKGLLKKYFSQIVLKVNEVVKGKESMKKME